MLNYPMLNYHTPWLKGPSVNRLRSKPSGQYAGQSGGLGEAGAEAYAGDGIDYALQSAAVGFGYLAGAVDF